MKLGTVEDGTAIGSAIASSVNRLRDQPSKSKIVVLLADGVNNAGKVSPVIAAEAAKALGVKVYTIGAGAEGEAPVPVTDQFGRSRLVMAKVDVDEETLTKIAQETGGKFFRATDTNSLKQSTPRSTGSRKPQARSKNSNATPSCSRGRSVRRCWFSPPEWDLNKHASAVCRDYHEIR